MEDNWKRRNSQISSDDIFQYGTFSTRLRTNNHYLWKINRILYLDESSISIVIGIGIPCVAQGCGVGAKNILQRS